MRASVVLVIASLTVAACEGRGRGPEPTRVTAGSAPPSGEVASTGADGGGLRMLEPASDAEVASLVRTRRLASRAEGRVLVVYAGASWCEPCKRFRAAAAQQASGGLARVDLLVFDADRDRDRLAAAGYVFTAVPFAALPGPDGAPAESAVAPERKGGYGDLLARVDAWGTR